MKFEITDAFIEMARINTPGMISERDGQKWLEYDGIKIDRVDGEFRIIALCHGREVFITHLGRDIGFDNGQCLLLLSNPGHGVKGSIMINEDRFQEALQNV